MAYQEDWLQRKIEILIKTLMLMTFGGDNMKQVDLEDIKNKSGLYLELDKLIKENKICDAEDLVFEAVEEDRTNENIKAGVLFYKEINKLSNDELKENNFSRNEIRVGLEDLTNLVMGNK